VNKQPPDSHLEDSLEEDFDAFYEEQMRNLDRESNIHRLSHPLTLLFILMPCLFVAIVAFVYMDVRKRLIQMESPGPENMGTLSPGGVKRVTSLSEKIEVMEESFRERLSMLENASKAMEKKLQTQRSTSLLANVKWDKATFKAPEGASASELADLKATLEEKVATQQASTEKFSRRLKKELQRQANAIKAFQVDLKEQGERLDRTSAMIETLHKKAGELDLDKGLRSEEILTKKDLEETKKRIADLERKANALVEELLRLENKWKLSREN
jgi:hypothetical protein